jgi:predicted ferric reductase
MSMSGMGHGGHGMSGMTMSGGIFTPADKIYARAFWYGVAGCVALLTLTKAASVLQARQRLRLQRRIPHSVPSRPTGWLSQAYATATALTREMLYPQPIYFTGRFTRYFTPLPVGRWLLLAFYWIVILCFLWQDTILTKGDPMYAYKWEKVGFRAAWVTVTQIPFVFLLSCKFNPISLLTGISYERFNWLHRWAARTMWLTAIVHWSFFYTEWTLANIVTMQMNMMPMVKYGFGAWGVITWMLLSGFGFFRDLCYELFVLQHIAAAGTLLWLLFVHVPSYAQYNIWLSVAFVAFDWGARMVWGVTRNMHLLGRSGARTPGYDVQLEALPGDVVRMTIANPDFTWQAGQHVYLYMPGLRPLELHPFTIASTAASGRLSMTIQARSGFSRTLYKAAANNLGSGWRRRAYISGPWGTPPNLSHYDTAVLIACSTGATFVVPLIRDLVQRQGCLRNITLHWIVRSDEHLAWFEQELRAISQHAIDAKTRIQIHVHVTQQPRPHATASAVSAASEKVKSTTTATATSTRETGPSLEGSSSLCSVPSIERDENAPLTSRVLTQSLSSLNVVRGGRPTVQDMIRPAVESARGETAVVVCGGVAITAQTRTFVAALSDERAVHKGTGAQGIFLFTETYGW